MLTAREKRIIENHVTAEILNHPQGINTRVLISTVLNNIAKAVPNANRHHVAGMLSWVWRSGNFTFLIRTPGYSIIA